MAEAENTQLVKDAYAAFQRGDINAILAVLDDNVEWQGVTGTEGVLPQAGLRRGRSAVAEFFSQVASTTDFERFEPREFVAQGDKVVVLGRYAGKAKPSGGRFDTEWVMVFRIAGGRIANFREFTDSAQLVKAFGSPVVT